MNYDRQRWQEQANAYVGKTVSMVKVTEYWTQIFFTDGSTLALRDNPQLVLKE